MAAHIGTAAVGQPLEARPETVDGLNVSALAVLQPPQPANGHGGSQREDDQVDQVLTP